MTKNKRPIFLVQILAAAGALALTLAQPARSADLKIKIGFVSPLTGFSALNGKDAENGARMAVEDLNARGVLIAGKKYQIELLVEDDAGDPKQATSAAQMLVDANVNGVVGHLTSGTSIPASKIYHQAGIPQITAFTTNPQYTHQGYHSAFRMCPNDDQLGQALGRYAVQGLNAKKIAVIDDATSYGQGIANQFIKTVKVTSPDVKIVAREQTTDKASDFHAILTKIKKFNPEVIFFGGMGTTAAPMLLQMNSLGIHAKLMGGDGICSPTSLPALLGKNLLDRQVICADLGGPDTKAIADCNAGFAKRYGSDFGNSKYSYDAVFVLIEAMKKAGSIDPQIYLPALAAIKFQGITGNIEFDHHGDMLNAPIALYTFIDGKHSLISLAH
jgi:branched-chain amino acid transport system substrate-binding protein